MRPRNNELSRPQKSKNIQGQGPNWILVAGGALLSTLSIRLGYKLKQVLDAKRQENESSAAKGNGRCTDRKRVTGCHSHSNMYPFMQDEDRCFNYVSSTDCIADLRHSDNGHLHMETDGGLPLVTVPPPEFCKENGVMWVSSPDRLELPPKPFHHSNCSDSPCVSESGSDIFTKREVINKLRQQLKRRDEMILEMQGQIVELQNSLDVQSAYASQLQSQLDKSNKDLFDSEREIQRLRKTIADHCVGHVSPNRTSSFTTSDVQNGHANGYLNGELRYESSIKHKGDGDRIEMLQKSIAELKEVLEGKDYLLQSYKEQKEELSVKIRELQQRLDSQLPNIL